MLRVRCTRVHNRLRNVSTHLLELAASVLLSLETHVGPFPFLLIPLYSSCLTSCLLGR